MQLQQKLVLAVAGGAALVACLGQTPIISFNATSGGFQIAGGAVTQGQILVSSNDTWGVVRAAGDLAADFGRVTGTNYTLSSGVSGAAAVAYTYDPINNMNNTVVSVHRTSLRAATELRPAQPISDSYSSPKASYSFS